MNLVKHQQNGQQYLYVIQCAQTAVVKIGVSKNPAKRLAALQTGYPFLLKLERVIMVDEPRTLERKLHSVLYEYRLRGEWYDVRCLQLLDDN